MRRRSPQCDMLIAPWRGRRDDGNLPLVAPLVVDCACDLGVLGGGYQRKRVAGCHERERKVMCVAALIAQRGIREQRYGVERSRALITLSREVRTDRE